MICSNSEAKMLWLLVLLIVFPSVVKGGKRETYLDTFCKNQTAQDYQTGQDYQAQDAPKNEDEPGQPLNVFVEFKVIGIDEIDGAHMDFRLHLYIKLFWKDPRLQRKEILTNDCSAYVWTPDIMFETAKSIQSFDNVPTDFRIEKTGFIVMTDRYSFKANCIMEFRDYPFDTQDCAFSIVFMTTTDDTAVLKWADDVASPHRVDAIKFLRKIEPLQYRLDHPKTYNITRVLTYGNYTYLYANFTLVRRLTGLVLTIYIPTALVVTVSWVTFWLKPEAAPARVSLSITSLLTLCTQVQQYKSHLPSVNYITAMDIWLFVCIFVVFSTLLEFALCYNAYIEEKERENKTAVKEIDQTKSMTSSQETKINSWTEEKDNATKLRFRMKNAIFGSENRKSCIYSFCQTDSVKMDMFCRTFFPSSFLAFTIIYWMYFIMTSV